MALFGFDAMLQYLVYFWLGVFTLAPMIHYFAIYTMIRVLAAALQGSVKTWKRILISTSFASVTILLLVFMLVIKLFGLWKAGSTLEISIAPAPSTEAQYQALRLFSAYVPQLQQTFQGSRSWIERSAPFAYGVGMTNDQSQEVYDAHFNTSQALERLNSCFHDYIQDLSYLAREMRLINPSVEVISANTGKALQTGAECLDITVETKQIYEEMVLKARKNEVKVREEIDKSWWQLKRHSNTALAETLSILRKLREDTYEPLRSYQDDITALIKATQYHLQGLESGLGIEDRQMAMLLDGVIAKFQPAETTPQQALIAGVNATSTVTITTVSTQIVGTAEPQV